MPQIVDKVGLAVALIVPILLVWRWRWIGVILGAAVQWGTLIIVGELLSRLDPAREGGLLDAIWISLGWAGALFYCILIQFAISFWRLRRSRTPT